MKHKIVLMIAITFCVAMTITGCDSKTAVNSNFSEDQSKSVVETTLTQESGETIAENDIDPEIYKMTGGLWYYIPLKSSISLGSTLQQ